MRIALLLAAAFWSGCVTPKPFALHPEAPEVRVKRLPLHVAVVVPEPMGSRITETTEMMGLFGSPKQHGVAGKPADRTALYHGEVMMPMERELSRVCSETFPKLFTDVDLLRQAPDPGQYDAVIQARVTESKILQRLYGPIKLEEAVALSWELEALDGQGVPFVQKTGVTEPTPYQQIPVVVGRMDGYAKVVGAEASAAVTGLVGDWVALLSESPRFKELAAGKGTK